MEKEILKKIKKKKYYSIVYGINIVLIIGLGWNNDFNRNNLLLIAIVITNLTHLYYGWHYYPKKYIKIIKDGFLSKSDNDLSSTRGAISFLLSLIFILFEYGIGILPMSITIFCLILHYIGRRSITEDMLIKRYYYFV